MPRMTSPLRQRGSELEADPLPLQHYDRHVRKQMLFPIGHEAVDTRKIRYKNLESRQALGEYSPPLTYSPHGGNAGWVNNPEAYPANVAQRVGVDFTNRLKGLPVSGTLPGDTVSIDRNAKFGSGSDRIKGNLGTAAHEFRHRADALNKRPIDQEAHSRIFALDLLEANTPESIRDHANTYRRFSPTAQSSPSVAADVRRHKPWIVQESARVAKQQGLPPQDYGKLFEERLANVEKELQLDAYRNRLRDYKTVIQQRRNTPSPQYRAAAAAQDRQQTFFARGVAGNARDGHYMEQARHYNARNK